MKMINFQFKVDSREHNPDLFLYFDLYSKEKGFSWSKELLEVGDIVCGNVCIERKEASDFVGSILDGRLKEQAMRMYANYEHRYIIIEGDVFATKSNINHNAIIGKMTSLCAKYGIYLINVNSPRHTVYTCYSIVAKIFAENKLDFINFNKSVRRLNDIDIVVAMLLQIPGLGLDRAKKIAEFYKTTPSEIFGKICYNDLVNIDGIGEVTTRKVLNSIGK
jgi:ERCC4-type nuclease